jgi:outer membrane protein
MMKKFFLTLALLLPLAGFAAETKIAVVDLEEVFNEYYKTRIFVANLKKQAEVFQAYAQKLNESRTKLNEEFKNLRDESQNLALSKAEQENKRVQAQEKYRQMKAKEAELQQYNDSKVEQLKEERAKLRDRILSEIKTEIGKRAALAGYTLVLDKSGKSLSGISIIVYHSPSTDITADIIKELNRGYEKNDKKE